MGFRIDSRRVSGSLLVFITALALLALGGSAYAEYARPRGATPLKVPLVPAFQPCTPAGSNSTHGAPLAFPSCNPPVQTSNFLTVGTPDANGAAENAVGSVLYSVEIGPPRDALITVSTTDVRCRLPLNTTCGAPNAAAGPDYTGQLEVIHVLRVTDHYNGPGLTETATMTDIPFPELTVPCGATTTDISVGSTCAITTTINAVLPGAIRNGQRAIWEMGPLQVYDGGASGAAGSADATLFEDEGVFVP